MSLLPAFGIRRGDVVAVVGAGGKTTLVFELARQARAAGLRTVVTTTTHMGTPEGDVGPLVVEDGAPRAGDIEAALEREGRVVLLSRGSRPDKLDGVGPGRVAALRARADVVFVEADGARSRSLKVPAAHEPVVPPSSTLVIVVAALDVVGQPLDGDRVHRLELVAAAAGVPVGAVVDARVVAAALLRYAPHVPAGARAVVFLNKAEDADAVAAGAAIAPLVVPPFGAVVAGSARAGTAATP